ncbi:MAG: 8-amino-7-oxononanoate synthase [Gammaproteobacteria bacterium]|nr:8-amino-7-oxononanoate synthase [Gammaproteobacteria bacterium]
MFDATLQQRLDARNNNFLLRSQQQIEPNEGMFINLDGKKTLSFSSNNYLGLSQHPAVIKACQNALRKYGVGSGSAYLVCGYTDLHKLLEDKLAEFLNYPRVLLVSSGYMANTGIISTLFSSQDEIYADKQCHASIIDGCLMSRATTKRYPHCNLATLEKHCQRSAPNKLIITEGLFGMDGDVAPLDKIHRIATKNNTLIMVDDAHGIGVLGQRGRGALELYNLGQKEVAILVGTLGKAFGSYGAFVAGSALIIDNLIQQMRPYLYTTALPPMVAAASLASLKIIQEDESRRKNLHALIRYYRKCAHQLGMKTSNSNTPIQPLVLGCPQKTLEISRQLGLKGLYVKAIRPPTVPQSSSRLRITLCAEHTRSHIDFLLESLSHAIKIS